MTDAEPQRHTLTGLLSGARAVVFDKDGTLVDLGARWVPFFRSFIDRVALECDDPALVADLDSALGVRADALVADGPAAVETEHQIKARACDVAVSRGHSRADAALAVNVAVSQARFGTLAPLGDVVGALETLVSAGLRIGLATSDSRKNTVHELTMLGITDLVEVISCGDDGGPIKPDPAVLLEMAMRWQVRAEEIIFVGDSRQDLATARAAGAGFVAVHDPAIGASSLDSEADASVATIDELATVVQALRARGSARARPEGAGSAAIGEPGACGCQPVAE